MTNAACIEHEGARSSNGYGAVWHGGKAVGAHRLAYCRAHGMDLSDIAGQVVRHKCDNPPCVNPDHLELGTHKDNAYDRVVRSRQHDQSGERGPGAVLTAQQVEQIRERYVPRCRSNGAAALSREFGVSRSNVSAIVNFKSWSK